jgi:hypothetical protein
MGREALRGSWKSPTGGPTYRKGREQRFRRQDAFGYRIQHKELVDVVAEKSVDARKRLCSDAEGHPWRVEDSDITLRRGVGLVAL